MPQRGPFYSSNLSPHPCPILLAPCTLGQGVLTQLLGSPLPIFCHQPASPQTILICLTILTAASLAPTLERACGFVSHLQQDLVTKAAVSSLVTPTLPCKMQRPHLTPSLAPVPSSHLDLVLQIWVLGATCTSSLQSPSEHGRGWPSDSIMFSPHLPLPPYAWEWDRSPDWLRDLEIVAELELGPGYPDSRSRALFTP